MHVLYPEMTFIQLNIVLKKEQYMATETHATPRNRRSFLRMIALGAGVAALVACGATVAKPSLTEAERAALEALGAEMAADLAAGKVKSLKGLGGRSRLVGSLKVTSPKGSLGDIVGRGTVKFFDDSKGFGFITDESGQDVFVHASGLIDNIREGDQVDYNLERGPQGLNAVDVKIR
jgi:CspA family cold shock protein